MSDTAFELTAEERALIEAERAKPAPEPVSPFDLTAEERALIEAKRAEPEREPDAFDGRCGAPKDPDRPEGLRCRLRLGTDPHGRPIPHGAEHHFVRADNLDADPPFPQEAVTTSKVNTTGNPA